MRVGCDGGFHPPDIIYLMNYLSTRRFPKFQVQNSKVSLKSAPKPHLIPHTHQLQGQRRGLRQVVGFIPEPSKSVSQVRLAGLRSTSLEMFIQIHAGAARWKSWEQVVRVQKVKLFNSLSATNTAC